MENNQQNKDEATSLQNENSNLQTKQPAQKVESSKSKSDDLSTASEQHSESSQPKGTNETLGTP